MNQTKAKQIRRLARKPDAALLVLIHKEYGDKTKDMDHRGVYKAIKSLYKKGILKI